VTNRTELGFRPSETYWWQAGLSHFFPHDLPPNNLGDLCFDVAEDQAAIFELVRPNLA